ncbi:MAG TPA: DUF3574 domain-containing protein [Caulobacter sp.]|nr:DUF3574 domain-containing protein [Caulobacter sp.]
MRAAAGLAIAMLLAGCVSVDVDGVTTVCASGLEPRATVDLYFGRNIGASLGVSDAEWAKFVDEEITPRFPNGLSVSDVAGQWKGADGSILREPSKAVMIVLSGEDGEYARLDAIRDAYKARFRQEAVMLVQRQACVGF